MRAEYLSVTCDGDGGGDDERNSDDDDDDDDCDRSGDDADGDVLAVWLCLCWRLGFA